MTMKGSLKNGGQLARYVNIALMVLVLVSCVYLYRIPKNRTFAVVVFLLTFAWLYATVVRRRTVGKK